MEYKDKEIKRFGKNGAHITMPKDSIGKKAKVEVEEK